MIEKCFQLFEGIGIKNEQKLWHSGYKSWRDVLSKPKTDAIPMRLWKKLKLSIPRYQKAIKMKDHHFLNKKIPSKYHWMLIPNFLKAIAYLDIETTGLSWKDSHITTIAVFDGVSLHNFIRGQNLEKFPQFISQFSAIVTYYGKNFDVPFISNEMGIEIPQIHFDTCFLLRKVKITGGLKSIEKQLGISRGNLADIDGYTAVILWHKFQETGDRDNRCRKRYDAPNSGRARYQNFENSRRRRRPVLRAPVRHREKLLAVLFLGRRRRAIRTTLSDRHGGPLSAGIAT